MNVVVRRRMAAGVVAVAAAVVAGFVVSPQSASAADTISLSPNTAFNTETAKTITITLASNSNGFGYPPGSTVTFTRQGTNPADSFSVDTDATSDPSQPTVTVDFSDVGDGVGGDGPANAGTYNVHIEDALGAQADDCTGCFAVLPPPSVTATKVEPPAIAAGGSANVTVTGSGFSRGVHIDVLQSDDTTPDGSIQANAAPTNSSGTAITSGITTPTTVQRRWTVGSSTTPGPRDVRVTNTDGSTAVCSKCFTVNGPPLTGVSPLGSSNDPNAGPVTVTFTGTNLNSGVPRLEFVADAGSSTKTDLTIEGQNPSYFGTSVSAEYDLRNAAPGNGAYMPTLTQADGSQNTCSCRFSIDQATSPVVKSLSPNSQKQGTTQTVRVTGTNFSKGVKITVSGTGVTTTAVAFVDPTAVDATFSVAPSAATGARDVTAQTTDPNDAVAPACTGCYTIQSNVSPSPSKSPSSSPCPTTPSSASPSASRSGTPSASASSTASPTATATASSSSSATALPVPGLAIQATDTPTPTSSSSATGTPTASSTASSTASASATSSASPSGNSCDGTKLTVTVSPKDIVPTQASTVRVHGSPNRAIEVWAYSRPSTTYGLVRQGTTNANGDVSFTVTPGGNTRLYAHYAGGTASADSTTTVITVHTSLSLSAYRDGVRKYHFQGTNLPRRAGQLITLYRYAKGPNLDQYCVPPAESDTGAQANNGCRAIIVSQAKTGPSNTWRIDRTFSASGQFYFVVRTSENINNGRGHSNQRLTVIK